MGLEKRILDQLHPSHDLEQLADYDALYRGGKHFEARIERFLPVRPNEPPEVYSFRKKSHHYVPYAGAIVDYFTSWLFTGRLEYRTVEDSKAGTMGDPPEWFAPLKEDCDTLGTDLTSFFRERMNKILVKRHAWILVDFPVAADGERPLSKADWAEQGLDKGYLCALDPECVLDWENDERGELLWVVVKHTDKRRLTIADARTGKGARVKDTWTVYGRETWERYEIEYAEDEPPQPDTIIPLKDSGSVATEGKVPLVHMELDEGLWLMNRLASPQLEQARARNALSWNLQRTCYAMRLFFLEGPLGTPPTHGPAMGMTFGVNERVEWDAPPSDAFVPYADYTKDLKDEIYRVANQMALGVDNNAAAVGRSGDSKKLDAGLAEVALRALGLVLIAGIERTLGLLSDGRGDDSEWHVSGMDSFSSGDVASLLEAATAYDTLAIPSKRARVLIHTKVVRAILADASQEDLDKIADEIESGTTDEEMQAVRDKARGVPALDPNGMLDQDEDDAITATPPKKSAAAKPAKKPAKPAPKAKAPAKK